MPTRLVLVAIGNTKRIQPNDMTQKVPNVQSILPSLRASVQIHIGQFKAHPELHEAYDDRQVCSTFPHAEYHARHRNNNIRVFGEENQCPKI